MRKELQDKEVLAMYDVRGIQSYIFKTNKVKEIIGASVLVENIITEGMAAYVAEKVQAEDKAKYLLHWKAENGSGAPEDAPTAFIQDSSVKMQVMFVGGGNAYVLFRKGADCEKLNRFLGVYVLKKSYSLKLAVAAVEKTESYKKDYDAINMEMRRIKAYMPAADPLGALPFMAADSITGYPLTKEENGELYCTESALKRANFPKDTDEKVFDNMVTEKGDNSTLAICHIDGNNMGKRIQREMRDVERYEDAVPKMRKLSLEISRIFRETLDGTASEMRQLFGAVRADISTQLFREIVAAGDDITFVCNAKIAIPAVKYFLRHVGDTNIGTEKEPDGYSACGGIAYFNSHFPFSDAYQVAEACCESAKKLAKQLESRTGKPASGISEEEKRHLPIGNFFDFQICSNIRAADLEEYRERHYTDAEGSFLARPYYVAMEKNDAHGLNEINKARDVERLDKWSAFFAARPRNKVKALRNVIPMGENERNKAVSFLESRSFFDGAEVNFADDYRVWYDAMEIMDFQIRKEALNED